MPDTALAPAAARPYHHGDLRRGLLDAASELMAEDQNWTFSLREVARRAGASHNAPYNHFASKSDLLVAIAAEGFERLRDRMLAAIEEIANPKTALIKVAVVYVSFGVENPARYRLMFGSALAKSIEERPPALALASASCRAVLEDVISRGARAGVLSPSPRNKEEIQIAVYGAAALVHGLTMLALDGLVATKGAPIADFTEKVTRAMGRGLFRK
jgi:AcrR family transcriptional regulator